VEGHCERVKGEGVAGYGTLGGGDGHRLTRRRMWCGGRS